MEQINNQQEPPEITEKKSKFIPILIILIIIVFLAIIAYFLYSFTSSSTGIYIKEVDYKLFSENNKYILLLNTTIVNNEKESLSLFGMKVEIPESGDRFQIIIGAILIILGGIFSAR